MHPHGKHKLRSPCPQCLGRKRSKRLEYSTGSRICPMHALNHQKSCFSDFASDEYAQQARGFGEGGTALLGGSIYASVEDATMDQSSVCSGRCWSGQSTAALRPCNGGANTNVITVRLDRASWPRPESPPGRTELPGRLAGELVLQLHRSCSWQGRTSAFRGAPRDRTVREPTDTRLAVYVWAKEGSLTRPGRHRERGHREQPREG